MTREKNKRIRIDKLEQIKKDDSKGYGIIEREFDSLIFTADEINSILNKQDIDSQADEWDKLVLKQQNMKIKSLIVSNGTYFKTHDDYIRFPISFEYGLCELENAGIIKLDELFDWDLVDMMRAFYESDSDAYTDWDN